MLLPACDRICGSSFGGLCSGRRVLAASLLGAAHRRANRPPQRRCSSASTHEPTRGKITFKVSAYDDVDAASASIQRGPALRPRSQRSATPTSQPLLQPQQERRQSQPQRLQNTAADSGVGASSQSSYVPTDGLMRRKARDAAQAVHDTRSPAYSGSRRPEQQQYEQRPQQPYSDVRSWPEARGQPQALQPHGNSGREPSSRSGFPLRTGLALTWLGTNSGSPTLERNVSCTLVRQPGAVQMVDCGEGTHRQLMALRGSLDLAEVDGIFITHLHGDHCFGLPAALAALDEPKAAGQTDPARRRHHVYGPPGLAELIRVSMISTGLARRLQLPIVVTEFVDSPAAAQPLRPLVNNNHHHHQQRRQRRPPPQQQQQPQEDTPQVLVQRVAPRRVAETPELTAAVDAVQSRVAALEEIWSPPYQSQYSYGRGAASGSENESPELSSGADDEGPAAATAAAAAAAARRVFVAAEGLYWEIPGCAGVRVRAAQLQHRVPCWGYVFTELKPYGEGTRRRKVVVLGDTVSSRPIAPLAAGCDVLSHEATFARGMEAKARVAQHSTGWMAGAFAAAVGARSLVLTHFSARYREGPRDPDLARSSRITGTLEAEQQSWAVAGLLQEAAAMYGRPSNLFAATDFYTFHVSPRPAAASGSAAAPVATAASGVAG